MQHRINAASKEYSITVVTLLPPLSLGLVDPEFVELELLAADVAVVDDDVAVADEVDEEEDPEVVEELPEFPPLPG